jgi:hypothetical protein
MVEAKSDPMGRLGGKLRTGILGRLGIRFGMRMRRPRTYCCEMIVCRVFVRHRVCHRAVHRRRVRRCCLGRCRVSRYGRLCRVTYAAAVATPAAASTVPTTTVTATAMAATTT